MKSVFLILCTLIINISAQNIIPYPGSDENLDTRWDWALDKANQSSLTHYWIVYTFERLMPENNTIGTYYRKDNPGINLAELLYPGRPIDYIKSLKGYSKHSSKKVLKEIALLFEIEDGRIKQVEMSTIDTYFKFRGLSVLWLGITSEKQSIKKIIESYNSTNSSEAKETLIAAVGMHKSANESFDFLSKIIKSNENNELREEAIFWIGVLDNPQAIPLLKEIAMTENDEDIGEKAVFSLQNMDAEESIDAIIFLTKKAKNSEVREKAVFWLGQVAGKKAIENLSEIAFSEDETDIQKQAVFALSQMDNGQGVPKLIKIANTHPNPKIRKNAIFWLGESDDDRALQALIEIVQK